MNLPLRSLLNGVGFRIAVCLTGITIGIFLTPFLLRSLGDREYAVFVFAGLWMNWCGIVDFGMTTASSRFVTLCWSQKDETRLNETANTAAFLFAFLGLLVLLATCTASILFWFGSRSPERELYAVVFLIAGSAFAVSKLSDALSGVINGVMRQDVTGGTALLFKLLIGAVTFFIAWFGGRVTAIVTGNLILAFLNLFLLMILVRRVWPPIRFSPVYFRKERMKELLGYSVYTFFNQLGNLLVRRSDLVVIGFFLSLTDVTCYNLVVVTFISYFLTFSEEMTIWLTNWFTHLQETGERELFERSRIFAYRVMTYITLFMALMLIFWSADFIRFWIGESYLSAFPSLILISAGMAFYRGSFDVNIRLLQGMAKHQVLAFCAVVQGLLGIGLSVFALKLGYGTFGVAAGTIVPAILVNGIFIPMWVCRLIHEKFSFYLFRIFYSLAIGLFAFLPSWLLIHRFQKPTFLLLAATASAAFLSYFSIIWFIGFSQEEQRIIKRYFVKRG